VRFAENGGDPYCPWCGHKEVYSLQTRRKWRCKSKSCGRDFSPTSGTVFASRKLSFQSLLLLVAYQSRVAKNLNAIDMSCELEVQYKTAFVWCHKIRETITAHQHTGKLRGKIEIDGGYFGGYIKPKNSFPLREEEVRCHHARTKRPEPRLCLLRKRSGP
jgi:transposase-like protein